MVAAPQLNLYVLRKALLFYMEKLFEQAKTFISQLDISKFDLYYGRLRSVADLLRKNLKTQLAAATDQPRQLSLEDEIDHLDVLLFACSQKPVDELVSKYKDRVTQLGNLRQLSKFVQKHPGIEHKAGVPKGGTFIIVYHEKAKTTTSQPGIKVTTGITDTIAAVNPVLADAIAVNPVLSEAVADSPSIKTSPAISSSKLSLFTINKLVRDLGAAGVGADKLALISSGLLAIANVKPGMFDTKVSEIADGIIIADFYLPYLCCSDCPPVQYIITEPNIVATVALDKHEFCSDDKTNYVFKVSPPGGVVTGEGVVSDNSIFSFNPSAIAFTGDQKEKEITFTYVSEDKTATLKIKVYRKPVADFEFVIGPASHREFIFTGKSQFGNLFDWDFGESADASDTSTKENPGSHVYKDEGEYTVTLKVTNGICSSTITKVISIVAPGNVNISLVNKEYCSDDNVEYPFASSPADATITGEGVVKKGTGFVFVPGKVDVLTMLNKTVNFTGTSAGNNDGAFAVVVHHRPSKPVFNFNRVGTSNTVVFTIKEANFAQLFRWNFGDGQTAETTARQITHQYLQTGDDFVVSLVSVNGPCNSEAVTVSVPLPPVVTITKTCLPAPGLVTEFGKLQSFDPNLFTVFSQQFPVFKEIQKFFTELGPLVNKGNEEHLKFFTERKTDSLLDAWVTQTTAQFNSDFRTLAFELFKILVDLGMLVACVKKEDINAGELKLSPVFKNISSNLNKLNSLINPTPGVAPLTLSAVQKRIFAQMRKDFDEELTRITTNNENKPVYKETVGRFINILKAMGF
jgi:PKD repeat protein